MLLGLLLFASRGRTVIQCSILPTHTHMRRTVIQCSIPPTHTCDAYHAKPHAGGCPLAHRIVEMLFCSSIVAFVGAGGRPYGRLMWLACTLSGDIS